MVKANKQIGIVTPLANEEATLIKYTSSLFTAVKKLKLSVRVYFVIDKASHDQTLTLSRQLAKKYPGLTVIYAPKNQNVVDAYLVGFKTALKDSCDYIIEMDAGFSHQPKEISGFIEKLNQGFDCVFGVRPLWSPFYAVPFARRVYSLSGTILSNLFLGTRLADMTSGFEAFTAKALKKMITSPLLSTGHFYQTEMRLRAHRLNLTMTTVPITYRFPSKSVNRKSLLNAWKTLFWYSIHRK